jgi:hypothetical protein
VLPSALRFAVGAAVGVVAWIFGTPLYNALLSVAAEPIVRVDSRLRNVETVANGRRVMGRGNEAEPSVPGVVIPADQLTYNLVLLLGLFATNKRGLRDRGFLRFLIALGVLFATHVLALVISLEVTFATRTAAWGAARYTPLAQDFWTAVDYGYRLFGMFGIAFACWWLARADARELRIED